MEIKDFKDIHKGKSCFIVGTGPSLNNVDISKLNNKLTLGMSRTILHPTLQLNYYCSESERTIQQTHYDLWKYNCDAKFVPVRYTGYDLGKNVVWVNFPHWYPGFPKFSFDCAEIVYWGCNVLYMALQLAVYMGFNPLYLVGIDWFNTTQDMKLHFHDSSVTTDYDPPKLNVQNEGMAYAAKVLGERGVEVYNLCSTSYLNVFPFKDLGEIL